MANFYENYLRLCALKKESPSGAAINAGFSNAAASHWSNGAVPSRASLVRLSNYFGCSISELLEKPEAPAPDTRTATASKDGGLLEEFERIFDALTPENQNAIIAEMLRRQREQ